MAGPAGAASAGSSGGRIQGLNRKLLAEYKRWLTAVAVSAYMDTG